MNDLALPSGNIVPNADPLSADSHDAPLGPSFSFKGEDFHELVKDVRGEVAEHRINQNFSDAGVSDLVSVNYNWDSNTFDMTLTVEKDGVSQSQEITGLDREALDLEVEEILNNVATAAELTDQLQDAGLGNKAIVTLDYDFDQGFSFSLVSTNGETLPDHVSGLSADEITELVSSEIGAAGHETATRLNELFEQHGIDNNASVNYDSSSGEFSITFNDVTVENLSEDAIELEANHIIAHETNQKQYIIARS